MSCMNNYQPALLEGSDHPFPASISPSEAIYSWYDLQNVQPRSPLDLIAKATIGGTVGTLLNIDTYHKPPAGKSWDASPFELTGIPQCSALGTDNLENVANAEQWNFQHLTRNVDPDLAPVFSEFIFLRAGTKWKMSIQIDLGGNNYDDLALSFLNNAATRGDCQGTVPVISWTTGGPWTGVITVEVTLHHVVCEVEMGLRGIDSASGNPNMFEMRWNVES